MLITANYSVRFASIEDHDRLSAFYRSYYQPGHPLFHKDFWRWQFGSYDDAKCVIAETTDGSIIGHMGYARAGKLVWLTDLFIQENNSHQGLTTALFDIARKEGPLAMAMVNEEAQALLAGKQWYRYADLQRYVLINNAVAGKPMEAWIQPVVMEVGLLQTPKGRYWSQPGLDGIVLSDGSTAVTQPANGGLRLVDVKDISAAANEAWELGCNWIDYLASWNDPLLPHLHNDGWKQHVPLPWFFNTGSLNTAPHFNLFSEEALPRDFLFHRSYGDVGRTSSLQ